MNKKKYDKNTQFFVSYAYTYNETKRIMSEKIGIHDILVENNCELSDGEVAQALEKVLNSIYSYDTYSHIYITILNWWVM